jgi:hypothetical protein
MKACPERAGASAEDADDASQHSNVYPWCSDLYNKSGDVRVLHGGRWSIAASCCRAKLNEK